MLTGLWYVMLRVRLPVRFVETAFERRMQQLFHVCPVRQYLKVCLFPVQRVAKIVASRAAAELFCFLLFFPNLVRKWYNYGGGGIAKKRKKKNGVLHRKNAFFRLA